MGTPELAAGENGALQAANDLRLVLGRAPRKRRASKMAQTVKGLATKPGELNAWNPRASREETPQIAL